MLPDYADVHEAASPIVPIWYDGNGVPRFAPFDPGMLGVYDKFALLVRIACQSCAREFLVGEGWTIYSWVEATTFCGGEKWLPGSHRRLSALASEFTYGDPPRHDCVGDSMGSENVKVEQAWERIPKPKAFPEWVRDADVEAISIVQEWIES